MLLPARAPAHRCFHIACSLSRSRFQHSPARVMTVRALIVAPSLLSSSTTPALTAGSRAYWKKTLRGRLPAAPLPAAAGSAGRLSWPLACISIATCIHRPGQAIHQCEQGSRLDEQGKPGRMWSGKRLENTACEGRVMHPSMLHKQPTFATPSTASRRRLWTSGGPNSGPLQKQSSTGHHVGNSQ